MLQSISQCPTIEMKIPSCPHTSDVIKCSSIVCQQRAKCCFKLTVMSTELLFKCMSVFLDVFPIIVSSDRHKMAALFATNFIIHSTALRVTFTGVWAGVLQKRKMD